MCEQEKRLIRSPILCQGQQPGSGVTAHLQGEAALTQHWPTLYSLHRGPWSNKGNEARCRKWTKTTAKNTWSERANDIPGQILLFILGT